MPVTFWEKLITALRENLQYVAIMVLASVVGFLFKLYAETMSLQVKKSEEETKFWRDAYMKTNEQYQREKEIENIKKNITSYPVNNASDDGRYRQE